MARTELERNVQPSLFDRLTDLSPGLLADPTSSREDSARNFRISVQRDVEHLLNTRRTIVRVPVEFVELTHSVHEFGLPDTTGRAVGTADGKEILIQSVRDTLYRFEPRLANIRVKLVESDQVRSPQIRFSIEATLRMDPTPEQVVFDTVLEVASGNFAVANENAAPTGR